MKAKRLTHALFSSLNRDVFSLLLDELSPLEAWRLAQTSTYLYQRVTQHCYWQRYLQKYFPFLRNWHRLVLPDNTSPFQLFSLAYQQHMLSKTKEQRRLIKAIAFDQLPFKESSLIDLKYYFKLKEKHHHIEVKKYYSKRSNAQLYNKNDKTEFNAYCKYHLWQWFTESQCTWTAASSSYYYTTPTDRVLISQGKIDEFFRVINSIHDDYYERRPASYFTPQLLLLLRLGYTDYIDQIIDFVCKHNFRYSFFFSFVNNCPYLSPLEYCIQYDDYDAFVKCYHAMWHFEPVKILRPNTLIMMAQSADPRYLDYIFKHQKENRAAIIDRLARQLSEPEAYELELLKKIKDIRREHPKDFEEESKGWREIRNFGFNVNIRESIYKKYGELFAELRQQLYNVFAASISACHRQKNKKIAQILLKKILGLANKTTPDVTPRNFKHDTDIGKSEIKQYFKSKQTLNVDDLYKTAIRLQPNKKHKASLRKIWNELDGPKQTEGYWHLLFGIVALIVAAILLGVAVTLLLLKPNIPLALPAIAIPIIATTAAVAAIATGIYLLYRSHQLYNPSTDELLTEAKSVTFTNTKHNITYPEDTSRYDSFPSNVKSKFDVNDSDWNNKLNLPRFFGDNKTTRHSTCNNCTPTAKFSDLENTMNFNFIM